MRVLWITNGILPPVCAKLGVKQSPKEGWVFSSLKRLVCACDDIKVAVATVYNGSEFKHFSIEGVEYYCLPLCGKSNTKRIPHLRPFWKNIKNSFKPDIVHIHGSEYTHGMEYCEANGFENVVVSIQGLLSGITRHYLGGLSPTFVKNLTFRDFVKRDWFSRQIKVWTERGNVEKEFLSKVQAVIGRTDWDRAHIWAINPDARYFYVGETLRDSFYKNKWNYSRCVPHSIFISQAFVPLKGAHMVVKALPLVLREYPDAKIVIAGSDIMHQPWYRQWGYAKYLRRLINKLGLEEHVEFVGLLDERQMCETFLKSNIYVCPSSIENSPNSLGEAQMLGVPHLASYVGGAPEITEMNHDVLYRFEEYEMLAKKICDVFSLKDQFEPYKFDESRYDGNKNTKLLIEVYKELMTLK